MNCSEPYGACPANVTATFNGNGGSFHNPTSKTILYNTAIGTLPSDPILGGRTFNGWFTAPTGGTQISTSTVMTTDSTYYAQWLCNLNGYSYPACTATGQTYTASSTYP